MFPQRRYTPWSLPSLVGGLVWVGVAATSSSLAAVLPGVLGAALLGGGVTQLVAPGDARMTQFCAFTGLVAAFVAVPYAFVFGPVSSLVLLFSAVAAVWGAGRVALQLEPHTPGVPSPGRSFATASKVAGDEAILGFEMFAGTMSFPMDGTLERVIDEVDRARRQFGEDGFLDDPASYHVAPPVLSDPEVRVKEFSGFRAEVLRFESGYAPRAGEPGRDRWLGYDECRDAWAFVLRHEGPPRPWLVATNGFRMGRPRIDVPLFSRFFHAHGGEGDRAASGLGLNVLIPVLPLHGPRRRGWHSGDGFLGIDVLDTIHAEAQGLWDMRRLLSWIHGQEAPAVGAFGLSLGGLTTANFASLADGLACAVPGIPLVDVRRLLARHGSSHQLRYAETLGFDLDAAGEVLRVINPTALKPRVPRSARFLFGATADRLVTPDHVRDLWRHWEEPEIVWYDGSHLSFSMDRAVWKGTDRVLRESGVAV